MKKIVTRGRLLVAGLVVVPIIAVGTAYAVGSADFLSGAQTWINANCSTAKKEENVLCYNFYKNGEQDQAITALQNSGGGGGSGGVSLNVYKNDGTKLGAYTSAQATGFGVNAVMPAYYDATIGRIVPIVRGVANGAQAIFYGNMTGASFESPDCTGPAYIGDTNAAFELTFEYSSVLSDGVRAYKLEPSTPTQSKVMQSSGAVSRTSGAFVCGPGGSDPINVRALTDVTLPVQQASTQTLQIKP